MGAGSDTGRAGRGQYPVRAEMLLQAAFFAASNPLFVIEWHTRRILAASESVERVFGYRPEEIRDLHTDFLHVDGESFDRFGEITETALTSRHPIFHCYYRMKRRDGSVFNSEHIVSLVTDEKKEPLVAISIVRDLSEQESALLPSPDAEPDFRRLSENIPGGLFQRVRKPDGTISYTYMRGILFHRMGVDPQQAQEDANVIFSRIHPDDRQRLLEAVERTSTTLSTIDLEVRARTLEGNSLWVRTISQPRRLDDGSVVWDGIILDITEQHRAKEELSYLAMFDSLTGLPNVRTFDGRVEDAIVHSRETGTGMMLAAIDIERFYTINERLGYGYGDKVLQTIAERLRSIAQGNDFAARYHGDEFLVMFQNLDDGEAVSNCVNRLEALFEDVFRFEDERSLPVKIKIGMAMYPGDADTAETLRRAADTALKHARNSIDLDYAFYSPDMTRQLVESLELEDALRDAIEAGEIEVHYQPQYDLSDGRLSGFETLARWTRNGQPVPPGQFIPIAEESGLIHPLGRLFAARVFADIYAWKREKLRIPPVAVNISPHQIREPRIAEWLSESLSRYGLDMKDITIEITESAFLLDFGGVRDILKALHDRGVRLSMDDFGTGFSSLSYLNRLPFSELKIDQTFISELEAGAEKNAIVQGIIDLAHALRLRVVAEGVETVEQLTILWNMQCDAAQGYLFAPPAPVESCINEIRVDKPHPVFIELPAWDGSRTGKKDKKRSVKKRSRKSAR